MSTQKQDILTAVKNLDIFLKVPELKGAKPRLNANGNPFVYTGGFNMVFQLEHQQKKWAFRVWHAPMGDNKHRYLKISNYLQKSNLPYFVDFIYDEKGLSVNDKLVDTIRMEWIEAQEFKVYLENYKNDKQKLEKLASDFLEMVKTLHKNQISHGDLQHGNILIDNSGKIILVDYDSICTPEIEGMKELVTGLRGYQHPSRFQSDKASLKADYFSELIIYLSILAIAEKPDLWDNYKVKDTEYLLFSDEDFKDIEKSAIYSDLKTLNKPTINKLLNILKDYLQTPSYLDLKPFYEFLIEIQYFKVSSKKISIGDKIELEWSVKGAQSVELSFDNNTKNVNAKDKFKHEPNQNTIYSLKAYDSSGQFFIEEKIKVKVIQKIEIIEFKANKTVVLENDEIEFFWDVKNTDDIKLIDPSQVNIFSSNNPIKVLNPKTGVYTLIATNQFFKEEKSIQITVHPRPEIKEFKASESKIGIGSKVTLNWQVNHAKSIKLLINQSNTVDVTKEKSYIDTPQQFTQYVLQVTGLDDTTIIEQKLEVKVLSKVAIKSFTSDKNITVVTIPIKFNWSVENADSIKICQPDNSEKDVTHCTEDELFVEKSGKYILKAQNEFFKDEASIYIHVEELPKIQISLPENHINLLPNVNMNLDNLQNPIFQSIEEEFHQLVSTPRKNTLGWLDFVKKMVKN